MKKYNQLDTFIENRNARAQCECWLAAGRLPHAILIAAEDGCGRNFFARLLAQAYLEDADGLVLRGVHPDCLVVEGEGASGNIPVKRVRELAYALNMGAVMTDGRRVALLRNIKSLNRNSANALLKSLEEPLPGVVFLLACAHPGEVSETILSRCAVVRLSPVSPEAGLAFLRERYDQAAPETLREVAALYGGRLGHMVAALDNPARLALAQWAAQFCDAALKADKLSALVLLEKAAGRDDMRNLMGDAALWLEGRLRTTPGECETIAKLEGLIREALDALGRYVNPKLLAARMVAAL